MGPLDMQSRNSVAAVDIQYRKGRPFDDFGAIGHDCRKQVRGSGLLVRGCDRSHAVGIGPIVQKDPAAAIDLQVQQTDREDVSGWFDPDSRRKVPDRTDLGNEPVLDANGMFGLQRHSIENRSGLNPSHWSAARK